MIATKNISDAAYKEILNKWVASVDDADSGDDNCSSVSSLNHEQECDRDNDNNNNGGVGGSGDAVVYQDYCQNIIDGHNEDDPIYISSDDDDGEEGDSGGGYYFIQRSPTSLGGGSARVQFGVQPSTFLNHHFTTTPTPPVVLCPETP